MAFFFSLSAMAMYGFMASPSIWARVSWQTSGHLRLEKQQKMDRSRIIMWIWIWLAPQRKKPTQKSLRFVQN